MCLFSHFGLNHLCSLLSQLRDDSLNIDLHVKTSFSRSRDHPENCLDRNISSCSSDTCTTMNDQRNGRRRFLSMSIDEMNQIEKFLWINDLEVQPRKKIIMNNVMFNTILRRREDEIISFQEISSHSFDG